MQDAERPDKYGVAEDIDAIDLYFDYGMSKADVKRFLYEQVRCPLGEILPGLDDEGFARDRLVG